MERFVIITIITKRAGSILDVAAALEPPLEPTTEEELNVFIRASYSENSN